MDDGELLRSIAACVVQGRGHERDEGADEGLAGTPGACELVAEALARDIDPRRVVDQGLSPGMDEVGARYESGEYLIPDMLAAAGAFGAAMEILGPRLAALGGGASGRGGAKVLLATVEGDHHDIGKSIVATVLRSAGFEVVDLGVDVPARVIAEEAERTGARLIGLSALLGTTALRALDVIKELERRGLRGRVRVVIGGAATSPELAQRLGVDGWAKDAFSAPAELRRLSAEAR